MSDYQEILDFWFKETDPTLWFQPDSEFDGILHQRFLSSYEKARDGHYDDWAKSAEGCLALCILLDQFPRGLFRGRGESFATDKKILGIVKEAVAKGLDQELKPMERRFLYLPFEHSENMDDQEASVALFEAMKEEDPGGFEYAVLHLEVIEKFGRFPKRNKALQRESTPEEQVYIDELETTGRSF